MRLNSTGRDLIYHFEGVRLKAYLDVAGIPTIGAGFTYYPGGKKVKIGDTITPAECDTIFTSIIATYEDAINKSVKVAINQNQFNALVSFTYNVGTGAFEKSTLLKRINANSSPDLKKAAFLMWDEVGKKVNPDLEQRRTAEADLFNKSIIDEGNSNTK